MARQKTLKTRLTEFIEASVKTFGYNSKKEYLNDRANKNFVVMEVSGKDENDEPTYSPIFWEDGSLMVLNTEALAKDEAAEYEGARVIAESQLYSIVGIA